MTDRATHLQWCKDRAKEYLEKGDVANGMASFMSDMNKHEGTRKAMENGMAKMLCMKALMTNNAQECIRCVDGFN